MSEASPDIQKVIDKALAKLRDQQEQVRKTKVLINGLCEMDGRASMFAESDLKTETAVGTGRRDRFYGQPLSTVVRWILEDRQAADIGPASVSEIYNAMVEGGYRFESDNEENAKRGLRISLTKNSAIFHKLPRGEYGLREWYPAAKDPKPRQAVPEGSKIGQEKADARPTDTEEDGEEFDFERAEKDADKETVM